MNQFRACIVAAALGAAALPPAFAEEAHHPGAQAAPAPAARADQPARGGMGMMSGMPMMGGAGMSGGMGMMGGGMHVLAPLFGMHAMGGVEHLEGRLAFLKAELAITPAQEDAWTSFAEAIRGVAKSPGATSPMMAGMRAESALERLGAMEAHLAGRLEAVRASRAALERLHPQLSEAQRKTLDALLAPPMGGMMAAR
jgi:hypothetical protein